VSEAFVHPETLRAFANQLRGYAELTGNCMGTLNTQIQRLGSTWRDQEYDRFVQEFQKTKSQLGALQAEIQKLVPELESDAQKADEIHRR
jgi:uncharacterized protein YukE